MRKLAFLGLTFAGGIALASVQLGAQTKTPAPESNTSSQTPGTMSQGMMPAQEFVTKAAVSDMFEIQSSKMALQKSKDASIRAFATRMIKDHTASTNKLKATLKSGKVDAAPPSALDDEHAQMLQQLQGLAGKDFDQAYVKMQVQGHQDALDLLNGYVAKGDNAALKKFAKSILPTVQDHMAHAQKLAQSSSS